MTPTHDTPAHSTSVGMSRWRLDGARILGLIAMHLGCLAVFWVGYSWTAVAFAFAFYLVRAFGLTAFYHRYYSHRAFKTSRVFQFGGAVLGALALQKGPLWWAAHHREHHRHSDQDGDVHSPHPEGFLWSHIGWLLYRQNSAMRPELVRDWMRFPELVWLERWSPALAIGLALVLFVTGELLRRFAPGLQTDGWMLLTWGFFVSTVFLYHVTYSVNSFAHLFGSRRFQTKDASRNNWWVALLALGEGWHNNHHHYQSSARQGFYWWEIDVTYYVLWLFSRLGLVWDLRPVPSHILQRDRLDHSI